MEYEHWKRNLYICLFGSVTTVASMTLVLPILPLYISELGVHSASVIVQWSGIAFASSFLVLALVSPLWGRLADRYGRKPMLLRASLGMAITMSMMGLATNVYELVGLRILAGLVGGYSSAAIILVATQTPKARCGWALGTLSTGVLAGNLFGPLVGGALPELIGLRATFFFAGGIIMSSFFVSLFLLKEHPSARRIEEKSDSHPRAVPSFLQMCQYPGVTTMLLTALMLMLANMSIEPIISIYVGGLDGAQGHVSLVSGAVLSAPAFASLFAATRLGRLADAIGPRPVIVVCLVGTAISLIPQAFVTHWLELFGLRFMMGLALAGLLPSITMLVRHSVPDGSSGTALGYSQSAQYVGQVLGPLLGGQVGGHLGMKPVFFVTSALLLATAGLNFKSLQRSRRPSVAKFKKTTDGA